MTTQRSIPAGRGTGLKTLEELSLENETLKTLVDKQAKRIQMWEWVRPRPPAPAARHHEAQPDK